MLWSSWSQYESIHCQTDLQNLATTKSDGKDSLERKEEETIHQFVHSLLQEQSKQKMEQLDTQKIELMDAEESIFKLSNRTFQHANQANDGFGKNLHHLNKAFQQESNTQKEASASN